MASFKFLEKRALRFPQNKMEYNQRKRKIERKDKSSQSPMLNKKEEEEEKKKRGGRCDPENEARLVSFFWIMHRFDLIHQHQLMQVGRGQDGAGRAN